jgi:putative chitinase
MNLITPQQLQALHIDVKWLEPLNNAMGKYHIDTPKKRTAFIATCMYESGNFRRLKENLNYSLSQLKSKFKKYFPESECKKSTWEQYYLNYEYNPDLIASRIYDGRLGNLHGEGKIFVGRGPIQITGRSNYAEFGKSLIPEDEDAGEFILTALPKLLEMFPGFSALSAAWFWDHYGCNEIMKEGTVEEFKKVVKIVTGGQPAIKDRISIWMKVKEVLEEK